MGVTEILALSSIIIAFLSVVITYSLFRLSMRQVSGDVIHRIIDRFEEPEMRDLRRMIYALDRDDFATWDKGLIDNVDKWGAELDIISTLLAQEENIKPFFMLYGDVFFVQSTKLLHMVFFKELKGEINFGYRWRFSESAC